ncbi:MAG: transposase [Methylococcaceae bacterium]|nr:transposase [Methylococcaceae bacterium]
MARPLRLEIAGGLYHVTSRGNGRQDIYLDDEDRQNWLDLLGETCSRFNWVCHAYCLMTNHYHIVIETIEGNLSQGMRQLNGVYTQRFDRRHGRVGHIFQGRYKAILVDKDSHLLELSRYVVLNPVRAGMINDAADWQWSSYLATIDKTVPPQWLQTHWLLRQFGSDRTQATLHYIDFVRAGVGLAPIWEDLRHQIYLGGDDFVRNLQTQISSTAADNREIPKSQRRSIARPINHYVENYADAKIGIKEAYKTGDYTMQQIAQAFGIHYSTVSRIINR